MTSVPFVVDIDDPDLIESMQDAPLIYHYCTPESFVGIIRAGCQLWATDHRYLNDSAEMNLGINRAINILPSVRGLTKAVQDRVVDELRACADTPHYIACFSERADVLSQWRAYGANGRGYCLGLRPESRLVRVGEGDALRANHLLTCVYDTPDINPRLQERFERQVERFEQRAGSKNSEDLVNVLVATAQHHAVMIKHSHFQEERELRMSVDGPAKGVHYRASRLGIVPYRLTESMALEEVWIGPGVGPNSSLALSAVEGFISAEGLNATVQVWSTSYRS